MGCSHPEQLERPSYHPMMRPWAEKPWKQHSHSSYHRFVKRWSRRLMRRLGKALLDDAPRKLPMNGWEW